MKTELYPNPMKCNRVGSQTDTIEAINMPSSIAMYRVVDRRHGDILEQAFFDVSQQG